ncbi:MAG: redoxin domain-containing protein [Caldilineaceae bacterium]
MAISPNTSDKSLSSIEKYALTFEVLTDAHNALARQYGLVFTMSEAVRLIYHIPAHNGDDTWELLFPATYVVNQQGMVVYRFVNADYTKRAEPATVVAVLQALHEGNSLVRASAKTQIAAPADQVWQTVREFNGLGQLCGGEWDGCHTQ